MAFYDDVVFPTDISFNAPGGPVYLTSVVETQSGFEQRNIERDVPLYEWDVGYGARVIDKIEDLYQIFMTMRGKAHGFLFKYWLDFKSCDVSATPARTDQTLGTAIAAQTQMQLIKKYTSGATANLTRTIYKPKAGTVLIDRNGTNDTVNWTVNTATGVITRSSGLTAGDVIKAGFEYYFPVRFDIDAWEGRFLAWKAGDVSVRLKETRAIA